jgi:hypothetical protein
MHDLERLRNVVQQLMLSDELWLPEWDFLRALGARVHDARRPADRYAPLWSAALSADQRAVHLSAFLAQFTATELERDLQLRAALALAAPFLGKPPQPLSVAASSIARSYDVAFEPAHAEHSATPYSDPSCLAAGKAGLLRYHYLGSMRPHFGRRLYVQQDEDVFRPAAPSTGGAFNLTAWEAMHGSVAPPESVPVALRQALGAVLRQPGHRCLLYMARLLEARPQLASCLRIAQDGPYLHCAREPALLHPTELFRLCGAQTYYDPRCDTADGLLPLDPGDPVIMRHVGPPAQTSLKAGFTDCKPAVLLDQEARMRNKHVRLQGSNCPSMIKFSKRTFVEMVRGYEPQVALPTQQPYYHAWRNAESDWCLLDDPVLADAPDAALERIYGHAKRRGVPPAAQRLRGAALRQWLRQRREVAAVAGERCDACVCPYEVATQAQLANGHALPAAPPGEALGADDVRPYVHLKEMLASDGDNALLLALALAEPNAHAVTLSVDRAAPLTGAVAQALAAERNGDGALTHLLHSLCHNCYVRIPRLAVAVLQPHVPEDDLLLQQLRAQVQPGKADAAAVQIACCLNQPLPDQLPLDFESYFVTSPEGFLQAAPLDDGGTSESIGDPAGLPFDVTELDLATDDDSLLRELEELLDA